MSETASTPTPSLPGAREVVTPVDPIHTATPAAGTGQGVGGDFGAWWVASRILMPCQEVAREVPLGSEVLSAEAPVSQGPGVFAQPRS